ncbi:hypothetical protein F4779DRAFT_642525 [Xylariaceae sp. FL0662B]|nr:hypothetical protein F4779DRAFT_642525 [Xylariaceae sp. FL0662B]
MASLRYIIDTEDEDDAPQVNKNHGDSIPPGPSSRSHDPSRTPSSSHANPGDQDERLASASTRRRGPPSRSTKSTATASPSAPSTPHPAPVRRQSTTSNESMDPGAYGGYTQSPASGGMPPSNMPMRPMANAPGEGSVPARMTPITGRVSRAKKGVPVHTCEICKPPKTYTRAEHLRRHQLSHRTPGFPCTFPGCNKAFHRADLLARHAQKKHDQEEKASSPSRALSGPSRSEPPASPGGGYQTMSGGPAPMPGSSSMPSNPAYPGNPPSYPPMTSQGGSSGQTPMSPPRPPPSSEPDYTQSTRFSLINNQHPSVGSSPNSGTRYFGVESEPRTSSPFSIYMNTQMLPHDLPSLTIPDNNVPGLLDVSPWTSSASEGNYSTSSDIGRRVPAPSYESPTPDWRGPGLYPSGARQSRHGSETGLDIMTSAAPPLFGPQFHPLPHHFGPTMDLTMPFPEDHTLIDHEHNYDPYSSVRSPTPPTIPLSAQSAENLVTVAAPPSIPDVRSMGARHKESAVLWGSLPDATFLTAINLAPHVRNAIPKYLDVYWKRFDTLYPLVHRKSFETAANGVLRCAMAAIGTQFLRGKEDRIRGSYLHEFAWEEVKRCPQWNVQIMQAILLCEFYARFRGRSVVRNPSQAFQSLYSRVSTQPSSIFDHLSSFVFPYSHTDRWHPYSTSSSSQMADIQTSDDFISTASTHEEHWNKWINAETYRRLLAACFVLDAHTSFSTPTTPIFLTRPSEDLWNARSYDAWEALRASKANMEPVTLSNEILTADRIATAPPLDRAIFLASEALRLPKRSSPSLLDLSAEVDQTSADRISTLFPGSAVANTYLALHYTPLHDLLAVSGESWLFTKKLASPQTFQQHKRRLQQWSGSHHAGAAAQFAAKALLAFIEPNDHNNRNSPNAAGSSSDLDEEDGQRPCRAWNMSDISDYWGMYVCALICWALGHRTTRGAAAAAMARATASGSGSVSASSHHQHHHHNNVNVGEKEEREARKWLRTVAGLRVEEVVNLRGQRQAIAVVGMVRRRLEDEAVGSKSRLLVDALRTLRTLEERVHLKWF